MASFVPSYSKKRERLGGHEGAFVRLIEEGADSKELSGAAETVRLAQIRAFKEMRAELPPSERCAAEYGVLEREIQFWQTLTADEVIAGYRSGHLRHHRATAFPRKTR